MSVLDSIKNMPPARMRQILMATGIFGGVSCAVYLLMPEAPKAAAAVKQEQMTQTNMSKPDEVINGPAAWQSEKGAEIEAIKRQLDAFKAAQNEAKPAQLPPPAALETSNAKIFNNPPPPPAGLPQANVRGVPAGAVGGNPAGEEKLIRSINLARGLSVNSASNGIASIVGNSGSTGPGQGTAYGSTLPNSAKVYEVQGVRPNFLVTNDGGNVYYAKGTPNGSDGGGRGESNSTGSFRVQKSYIPSGTILRAVLLGGVDAPTGGESASTSPHPLLLRVTDMAQLPNKVRKNFKNCFVLATGYGDLSSERVIARTEQMSCVARDGRAIDISIKGYLAGEDGKNGLRGNLVTKQGAVLKNAMISGVLSGLGQGFATAATATTVNGSGSFSATPSNKQIQAALGQGAGNAFNRLADYYVKLADKMFPVVEVNAGRGVDIVLLKGFQIEDGSEQNGE